MSHRKARAVPTSLLYTGPASVRALFPIFVTTQDTGRLCEPYPTPITVRPIRARAIDAYDHKLGGYPEKP